MLSSCVQNKSHHSQVLPSLISTIVGALAYITPVKSEPARLYDSSTPLSVKGFKFDHDECLWFASDRRDIDFKNLKVSGCGEIEPWSLERLHGDFNVSQNLYKGSQIQCALMDPALDLVEQLEYKLKCVADYVEDNLKEAEHKSLLEDARMNFYFGSFSKVMVSVITAAFACEALQPHTSIRDLEDFRKETLIFSSVYNILTQEIGLYIGRTEVEGMPSSLGIVIGSLTLAGLAQLVSIALKADNRPEDEQIGQALFKERVAMFCFTFANTFLQSASSSCLGDFLLGRPHLLSKALNDTRFSMNMMNIVFSILTIAWFGGRANEVEQQGRAQNPRPGINANQAQPAPINRRIARPNDNVHAGNNLSIAREQIKKLQRISQALPKRFQDSNETTWARVQVSLSLLDPKHTIRSDGPQGKSYLTKSSADTFLKTLDNVRFIFNREFGDLKVSPRDVFSQVWRVATAKAMADEPTNEDLREKVAGDLLEQCARIATTVHGSDARAMNPCGSGKIESLMQFAQTLIPELDLFQGRLTSLPESRAIQNEFHAGFARDAEVLRRGQAGRMGLLSEADIKKELRQEYVINQKKMSFKVFNELYKGYERALGL